MFNKKTFKKLIKHKKTTLFYSKVNELISNENNHKFWDILKSMNEYNLSYNNRDLKHRQRNRRRRRFAIDADWAKGFVFGGENEV